MKPKKVLTEPLLTPEQLAQLSKRLTDSGKLIEAGWVGYLLKVVPRTAGPTQRDETRKAFFAGAQHLFASIMALLEPGEDASEADLSRMDAIAKELDAFVKELREGLS